MNNRNFDHEAAIEIGIRSDYAVVQSAIDDIVQATNGLPLRALTGAEQIVIDICGGLSPQAAARAATRYDAKRAVEAARDSDDMGLQRRWTKFAVAVALAHGEEIGDYAESLAELTGEEPR